MVQSVKNRCISLTGSDRYWWYRVRESIALLAVRYYAICQVVEWYHPWASLAPTLTQYMDEQDQVLVCGCGNSEMSVDMYDDGESRVPLI